MQNFNENYPGFHAYISDDDEDIVVIETNEERMTISVDIGDSYSKDAAFAKLLERMLDTLTALDDIGVKNLTKFFENLPVLVEKLKQNIDPKTGLYDMKPAVLREAVLMLGRNLR